MRPNYSSTNRLQKYIKIGEKESAEKLVKSAHCPTTVLSWDWTREAIKYAISLTSSQNTLHKVHEKKKKFAAAKIPDSDSTIMGVKKNCRIIN